MYIEPKLKKRAEELEFISIINRDGKGVSEVPQSYLDACKTNSLMRDDYYSLHPLSITEGTFIAFNFNAYIVKIKKS
jgi:hypothetical protein